MIRSILDSDLYKFSMQAAVAKLYPNAEVRYSFFNRGKTQFPRGFGTKLKREVEKLAELSLQRDEEEFLRKRCPFLSPVYIDLLRGYQFNPDEVHIEQTNGDIKIDIEGYWYRTILWEVPLMALISELYFDVSTRARSKFSGPELYDLHEAKAKKFELLGVKLADFGTRRRYSYENHYDVVDAFKMYAKNSFVGTSNVHLAHQFDIKPIGTQAHEWFMFHAAKYGFHQANSTALGRWVDVYNGDLGIALTDTFTTNDFFRSFDMFYAKLFDGVRHDSGDPIQFGLRAVNHYERLGIDPLTKTLVFSDGLNYDEVARIEQSMKGAVRTSYGIGTWLTNDIPDVTPLNMVIKMTAAKPAGIKGWIPTIKLSDVEGKHTGDKNMIKLAKAVLSL